jgi:hypothetical protein
MIKRPSMKYPLPRSLNAMGGWIADYTASYADLRSVLGAPRPGDGYKTTTSFMFYDTDARCFFELYDSKATDRYAKGCGLPSRTRFRQLPSYDWHVRCSDSGPAMNVKVGIGLKNLSLAIAAKKARAAVKVPA